jgi:3-deoxy-D-manno-octulosonic-acid transferase
LIIVETELWPELIGQAQKRAIPVMVVAGRVSQKSSHRYQMVRSLIQPLLARMAFMAVIGQADRARFIELGASPATTWALGNPKFDPLIKLAQRKISGIERPFGRQVMVAGSTEEREERLIVESWLDQTEKPHLLVAPRRLGRLGEIVGFLKERGLNFRLYSERADQLANLERTDKNWLPHFDWASEPDIILVDQLGVLGALYAIADLAIVGGSFFAGSGHNPLEPAAYGVPVIFGPHMSSFAEEAERLVAAGAAISAHASELPRVLAQWLAPGSQILSGQAGRELLANRDLVGPRLAALVGRAMTVPFRRSLPA